MFTFEEQGERGENFLRAFLFIENQVDPFFILQRQMRILPERRLLSPGCVHLIDAKEKYLAKTCTVVPESPGPACLRHFIRGH